jgi:hypothetical protein
MASSNDSARIVHQQSADRECTLLARLFGERHGAGGSFLGAFDEPAAGPHAGTDVMVSVGGCGAARAAAYAYRSQVSRPN